MRLYFLDSSALVKRYAKEQGSLWVKSISNPQALSPLLVVRITWVEVFSGLARLQRQGNLTAVDMTSINRNFQYDWDTQYQIVEIDWVLAQVAGQLVQKYPLRAYDSVQLAAALKLQAALLRFTNLQFTFVSADQRLLTVAQMEGLLTENPNHYP